MIAVAHRHGRADSAPRLGFLRDWGVWKGAFATTVSHDSHNLTIFGGNAWDMAVAANAVIAAGGGMAVASGQRIDALLPLPVAGLVSEAPLDEVARGFAAIRAAMDRLVEWRPPYLVFKACFGATLACNSGPHLTDRGIADVATDRALENALTRIAGLKPIAQQFLFDERRPELDARGDGGVVEVVCGVVVQGALDGRPVAEPHKQPGAFRIKKAKSSPAVEGGNRVIVFASPKTAVAARRARSVASGSRWLARRFRHAMFPRRRCRRDRGAPQAQPLPGASPQYC